MVLLGGLAARSVAIGLDKWLDDYEKALRGKKLGEDKCERENGLVSGPRPYIRGQVAHVLNTN